jgi:hypothetical protein
VKYECPAGVLPFIASEVEKYGCVVDWESERSGWVRSVAGAIMFRHDGNFLHCEIANNNGHFSKAMLVGGIRQLVEETMEREVN